MRKPYSKPELFAESYELVEHVAGPCNFMDAETDTIYVSHRNKDDCYFSFVTAPDQHLFAYSNSVCDPQVDDWLYHSSQDCYNGTFASTGKQVTYFAS